MSRVTYKAYKGRQLQETSHSSQPEVQEAKVELYRKLLSSHKLTHVEVWVGGSLTNTMVPQKEGKDGYENT